MRSLDDDDSQHKPIKTNPKVDFPHTQIQDFDSQFTPPPSPGVRAEEYDDKKLQFDDRVPVEHACETQALNFDDEPQTFNFGDEPQGFNFGDETQVLNFDDEHQALNFGDETQVLDFGGETQVLDFGHESQPLDYLDGVENIGTQRLDVFDNRVADDSDNEGSDRTEVLGDSDDIADDDSVGRGSDQWLEKEKACPSFALEGPQVSTTPVTQGTLPRTGSVRRFTSIRVASLRASGIAARSLDLKETNCNSCSAQTNGVFSDQDDTRNNWLDPKVMNEIDQVHDLEKDNEKGNGLRNGNKGRLGSLTVRKLFSEESLSENEGLPCNYENIDGGENQLQLPVCDVELAGLSYIDSQEPGELSQANALKFVEMYIEKSNFVKSDHEMDSGKSTGGKSKPVSIAKGPQSLAKKVNNRSTAGEKGIFDWDDNQEDEGGGDIFCRRKEELFGSGNHVLKSSTEPQKPKKIQLDVCRDNEKQLDVLDKIAVCSDSRVMLHNMKENKKKAQKGGMKFKKNIAVELDEKFDTDSLRGQVEEIVSKTDVPEMLDVGPDTQMAAEAMEALFFGEVLSNHDAAGLQSNSNGPAEGSLDAKSTNKVHSSRNSVCVSDVGVATKLSKKIKRNDNRLTKPYEKLRTESDLPFLTKKQKRAKSTVEERVSTSGSKIMDVVPSKIIGQRTSEVGSKSSHRKEFNRSIEKTETESGCSIKQLNLSKEVSTYVPIAYRTRHSKLSNKSKTPEHVPSDCREDINHLEVFAVEGNGIGSADVGASEVQHAERKSSKLGIDQSGDLEKAKPCKPDKLYSELTTTNNGIATLIHPKGRRSQRSSSRKVSEFNKLDVQSKPFIQPEGIRQFSGCKRSRSTARNNSFILTTRRKTRSSVHACAVVSSEDQSLEGKFPVKGSSKLGPQKAVPDCNSADMKGDISTEVMAVKQLQHPDRKSAAHSSTCAEKAVNDKLDRSPGEKCIPSDSACLSPANFMTTVNAASPVCIGNEYLKESCKKNLSRSCLMREISSLSPTEAEPVSPLKDLRKRRDMSSIRVLFSHHLDEDIIKQQKKILARLGASEAFSITDATHFITDKFVRTRNMLEAIASGKPVVTHLWLKSIGQVRVHIDEEAYLLRDTKKEKEFGFSMPVTLARARKLPLLQGRRVLITPNIKPSKETISGLVKAVHGQAVERIGRSALKDDKVPDLLILSCEEDYGICEPFLEKAVYSSELLLNGIVIQKLEYERHRLFSDHVKRTRSTIWLKKNDLKFHPVTKLK
ncbi:uncharacterized protein LOC123221149 isoform X2 [Mangifera indica]|uniref:uncharacterized protein LOC123221149 isoform X2 n=1 Tax=Mangifera indica TaxID=29780 RepID=UPI001CFA8D72|nr:uncharacterized protein LOC123221149 isoform X2 [Mangifera indica]